MSGAALIAAVVIGFAALAAIKVSSEAASERKRNTIHMWGTILMIAAIALAYYAGAR